MYKLFTVYKVPYEIYGIQGIAAAPQELTGVIYINK